MRALLSLLLLTIPVVAAGTGWAQLLKRSQGRQAKALTHAQAIVELSEQVRDAGRPGYLPPMRSEAEALGRELKRLEGVLGQLQDVSTQDLP